MCNREGASRPLSLKEKKMKSKIDVRVFAVNKAVEVMGGGALIKDVVAKAKEIEEYVIGEAALPGVADEASPMELLNGIASIAGAVAPTPVTEVKSKK